MERVAADKNEIRVCGIDPGLVNMSTWVGSYFPETHSIKTKVLAKCPCGGPLEPAEKEEEEDDGKSAAKKQSVQASSADSAVGIANMCIVENVDAVVVETAPQWNVPIRLSAATIYGVLRGKGVPNVKFSSACTKAKAIEFFADQLGIEDQLEKHPEGVDKRDKKISAKIRLINKRNSVKVAAKLLEHSADAVGLKAFRSDLKKQDDMADAILLGCGTAFGVQKQRDKDARAAARALKAKSKKTAISKRSAAEGPKKK
jgi:hypothetical protein